MTHVVVTGGGGFVGRALVHRLLNAAKAPQRLTVLDQRLDPRVLPWLRDPRVRAIEGDLSSEQAKTALMADPIDQLFHLASVPGALAERDPALGIAANLTAPLELFNAVARRHTGLPAPRIVFASSVAVYGKLNPERPIDEDAPTKPLLSYGTHKLMIELFLADLSRRGELDAVSLRLPGIVARPPEPTGHGSAFMSDLIRRGMTGQTYECPVSPRARCWWMSIPACVDNVVHAAAIATGQLPRSRVVQLPVLTSAVSGVVDAIAQRDPQVRSRLTWAPDAAIEQLFGEMPLLLTPRARGLGFADDGDVARMVVRSCVP